MTAPTPEQMRALAEDVQHTVDNGYEFAPENVVAALRTAADQLEAVQKVLDDPLRRWIDVARIMRTADTAPQEDRDA
jgi:hypothetical protein